VRAVSPFPFCSGSICAACERQNWAESRRWQGLKITIENKQTGRSISTHAGGWRSSLHEQLNLPAIAPRLDEAIGQALNSKAAARQVRGHFTSSMLGSGQLLSK
jgi:hypothetical protein